MVYARFLLAGRSSLLFDWLVERINRSMDNAAQTRCTIGVLDIFGFEVLDSNCFEQLCINYANEKLHQQFTKFFFRSEQEAYVAEEIPWEQVRHSGTVTHIRSQSQQSSCLKPLGAKT